MFARCLVLQLITSAAALADGGQRLEAAESHAAMPGVFAEASAAEERLEVLVTGATGPTGSLLYRSLKERGVAVRAFVRSAEKAHDVLGCIACNISEHIYVGDITQQDSLREAARGATSLAIVTSAIPVCDAEGCSYPEDGMPVDVDWLGALNQLRSFVKANDGRLGHVVLLSTMGTTTPNGAMDQIGDAWISFYKLNFEAALMSSGVPFTIVKACGLMDREGGEEELIVGSHDSISGTVARADVAEVLAEALLQPVHSANLRFDFCSSTGSATSNYGEILRAARVQQ